MTWSWIIKDGKPQIDGPADYKQKPGTIRVYVRGAWFDEQCARPGSGVHDADFRVRQIMQMGLTVQTDGGFEYIPPQSITSIVFMHSLAGAAHHSS
jgi:hypothetical protein